MTSMTRDVSSPSFEKTHERLRVAKVHLWKSLYSAFMRIQEKEKKRYMHIKQHTLDKYFYQLFFIITFDSTIV